MDNLPHHLPEGSTRSGASVPGQRRSLGGMALAQRTSYKTPGVAMREMRQSDPNALTGAEAAALKALGDPDRDLKIQMAALIEPNSLWAAIKDKEPSDLTDEEIFGMCWHKGVPIHVNRGPDGAYNFEVSVEIAIAKISGRFQIFQGKVKPTRIT